MRLWTIVPSIQTLLLALGRSGVTELALATGRLPCVKQSGAFVPVTQEAIDHDGLLDALIETGGGAAVMTLADKPITWSSKVAGLGVVTAVAIRRDKVIQARFVLTTREPRQTTRSGLTLEPDSSTDVTDVAPPSSSLMKAAEAAESHAPKPVPTPPLRAPQEISLELDVDPREASRTPRAGALPRAGEAVNVPPARTLDVAPIAPPSPGAPVSPLARSTFDDARTGISTRTTTSPTLSRELGQLLRDARSKNATDVHVVAERPANFRINGALVPQGEPLAHEKVAAMLLAMVPTRLAASLEQTGSCDFALTDAELGRFRVNVARQRSGLKGCFRLISREIPNLVQLGLPQAIADATHHHQGLILVTGPTGSGKSTTLAALVDCLNRETSHHIITIEDPIEHLHQTKKALLSQREVGSHTKSFAAALKGSLREDPDVIVVGELRDTETVRMALTASETGHLVLATMNTPSAAKTIERLIDLFPTADQGQVRMTLAGGLRLVVGQRLVPSTQGGMVAVAEILPGNIPLWTLIRENRTFQIPSLQQRGKQLGIVRLDDQLNELLRAGRVSLDAARFVAESPETLGQPTPAAPTTGVR